MEKNPENRFSSARSFRSKIAEVRAEHAATDEDVRRIFEVSSLPTTKIKIIKPGSTQDRIQRGFGVETTPARSTRPAATKRRTKPTTTEVIPIKDEASSPAESITPKRDAAAQQVKALLLGAEKLLEARHFQEARLQLEAAHSLDPDSSEVKRLREAVDSADNVLQNRRKEATSSIEELLKQEDFAGAVLKLSDSVRRLGSTDVFTELSTKIDKAEAFAAERKAQAANILASARRLLFEKEWYDVAPLAREALVLEPGNAEAESLLKAAETGIKKDREAQQRAEALEQSILNIRRHIADHNPDEAQKTLNVAHRRFGTEYELKHFAAEIENLRTELERNRAHELVTNAEKQMQEHQFSDAITMLEESLAILGADEKASELLAGAREGLRLQIEAARRQKAIDGATLSIDRLVLAGRLESAYRVIDVTINDVGEFDLAGELRTRVDEEISAREKGNRRLEQILRKVDAAISNNNFSAAEEELAKTRELIDQFPEMAIVVDDTARKVKRQAKDHRRSVEINAAVTSIRQRIDSSDLNGAERELRLASRLYGSERVFDEIRQRLKAAKTRQEIDILLASSKDAEPTAALDMLEKARDLDPDNADVKQRLDTVRTAVEAQAKQHRARLIEQAMEPIDALIAKGRLDEALTAVTEAVKELGDFPEAHGLQRRLQQMLNV